MFFFEAPFALTKNEQIFRWLNRNIIVFMLKYTKEIGSIGTSYFMSTFWQRAVVFYSRNLSSELTRITRHYKSETFGQFNIFLIIELPVAQS